MKRFLACLRAGSAAARLTDRQLLDRFSVDRDEVAFAELVRRHGPLVWGICHRNLTNPPDAEDAFQASFLVLARRASELRADASLGPWLYRVAASCCRTVRRGNRRRLNRVQLGLSCPVPSPAPADDADLGAILDEAILALPPKYRIPVVLCHLQDWTRQQAAAHLGCPEGTLSARLSRALAKLRTRLAKRDPAATLAVAGASAVPPVLADAAVRAVVIYSAAAGGLPRSVISTANGVLRMLRVKQLQFVAAVTLIAAGIVWLGSELIAGSDQSVSLPAETPPARSSDVPTLTNGTWELAECLGPNMPKREAILTIHHKNGQPAITKIDSEIYDNNQPQELTVSGRRVTFTIIYNNTIRLRFDGLFDPADPTRVLGSIRTNDVGNAYRAVLELMPSTGPRKRKDVKPPPEWERYVELEIEHARVSANARGEAFEKKTPEEQSKLRASADAVEARYHAEVPGLFRKLVADQPDGPFGYEAAMTLFAMLGRLKTSAAEIDAWAKAAGTFAATHGPQFEADTAGRIAKALIRHGGYPDQARTYAARADKLATAAGMTPTSSALLAEYSEERAAWAKQANPPAAEATWTVTVGGRVTNAKGDPVAGTEVMVNRTSWVKRVDAESDKATTGPDGRYTLTLKCQGAYRLHVRQVVAVKRGYVNVENNDVHKLLPGQSATVNFTLDAGEKFGGTLKVRPNDFERADEQTLLRVSGTGVVEFVNVKNGGTFEMSLPPGVYDVELTRGGGKNLTWSGLKTGRTDHLLEQAPFQFTPETVGPAFDQMWKAIDRHYSYFVLKPDVDWAKLRDEYRPKAVKSKSAGELADVLKEMLGLLKDGHVWIEMPDGNVVGTHRTTWQYNGNRKVILAQLTDVVECGEYAIVGRTKPDGFGYFLMTRQSAATQELVSRAASAVVKLADAPGFVIDLRNANGGSEPFAQQIAELFCAKKVVYAKSRFRDGPGHDEFTKDYERTLGPSRTEKPYVKPVVCLLGPGCVSSGEGFAKMMAALPHVTTVGLPTRGSSGNPAPVEVGESGLVVYFSRWVDLLPDGTPFEGKGVPPKVRVDQPVEAYKEADPTLAKGLEILRDGRAIKK